MKFEYDLTLEDYKAALALHYRRNFLSRMNHLFLILILPGLALLILTFQVYLALTQEDYLHRNLSVTLILLLVFASLPLLYRYKVRRQFGSLFPRGWPSKRVSIDFDDERIISEIPGASEGKFFWTAILKSTQDEKITLFYVAKNRFLFIPTQAIPQSQRTELNNIVTRKLVKR